MFTENDKIAVTKAFGLSEGFLSSSRGIALLSSACVSEQVKRLMEEYSITWKIVRDSKTLEVTSWTDSDTRTVLYVINNFVSIVGDEMVELMLNKEVEV